MKYSYHAHDGGMQRSAQQIESKANAHKLQYSLDIYQIVLEISS